MALIGNRRRLVDDLAHATQTHWLRTQVKADALTRLYTAAIPKNRAVPRQGRGDRSDNATAYAVRFGATALEGKDRVRNILVVDDDDAVADVIAAALES